MDSSDVDSSDIDLDMDTSDEELLLLAACLEEEERKSPDFEFQQNGNLRLRSDLEEQSPTIDKIDRNIPDFEHQQNVHLRLRDDLEEQSPTVDNIVSNKKKRKWVHEMNKDRLTHGEFNTLMPQLREDEKRFYMHFRMTSDCFDEILNLIKDDIRKKDTTYRKCISPEERLAIALRFLATGDSCSTVGHSYRVGISTVGSIVKDVCDSICDRMQNIYLPEPTQQMWEKSAQEFYKLWQFPNCIGSIDSKLVNIKFRKNYGSNRYFYLKKNSNVLMTIVGPDYNFLYVDIGRYGKFGGNEILATSTIGKQFEVGSMNVPDDANLPEQNKLCPHVLIGDEAFALKSYLMRPFPHKLSETDSRKEKYNTSLRKARCVVENSFDIMAQRFRIFYKPMEFNVEACVKVIKAACILHNFLRTKTCDKLYFKYLESPELTMGAFCQQRIYSKRPNAVAIEVREKFVRFFNKNSV